MPLTTLAAGTAFTVLATEAVVAELASAAAGRHARAVTRISTTISTYAEQGAKYRGAGFKVLTGDASTLVEFRHDQVRVLGYYAGRGRIVLCHTFIKKTDETPRAEIRAALLARDSIRKEGG